MSKRNQAIEIMKANATLDMNAVVTLIAKAIDVSEANARSYYRYIVKNGLATGNVVAKVKKAKTKQIPAEKMLKDLGLEKVAVPSKDLEEIKAIKAKNLETLRKVSGVNATIAKINRAQVREDFEAAEAEAANEDPRDFVPKHIHKELGLL